MFSQYISVLTLESCYHSRVAVRWYGSTVVLKFDIRICNSLDEAIHIMTMMNAQTLKSYCFNIENYYYKTHT